MEQVAKVAPGTPLREAIDRIIRAQIGALIVIGGEPEIDQYVKGGFRLEVPFNPALVYELAKMDGAIVLDQAVTRIRMANVEVVPGQDVETLETGMRHRTAERLAKTRHVLVVAISERRGTVSLYYRGERFVLHDLSYVLTKAQGAVNSLSRYDRLFRAALRRLTEAEMGSGATLKEVVDVLRRGLVAQEIRTELLYDIIELGRDGHLIDMQLEEFPDIRREWHWIWRDYHAENHVVGLRRVTTTFPDEDWYHALGYSKDDGERVLWPRGYRLLHQVPRLPEAVIQQVVTHFGHIERLKAASLAELDQVDGVGPQRAALIYRLLHGDTGDVSP